MRWSRINAPEFDLEKTLNCGQVFHWEKCGIGFAGALGDEAVMVEQKDSVLRFVGTSRKRLSRYFALDHPLAEICSSFPRDAAMSAARDFCQGLRIIRQPKWECLATFICSSMKQVAHIRQISLNLRHQFGAIHSLGTKQVHDFPAATRLAGTTEDSLRRCGLGYRAKNLLAIARLVATGQVELEEWRRLPDGELRTRLCDLPGVGPKVANCVMLFAYERIAAFPIDVWIERVLRQNYFNGKKRPTATALAHFTGSYFGPHGGYAQQYLFHHARSVIGRERELLRAQQAGARRRMTAGWVRDRVGASAR